MNKQVYRILEIAGDKPAKGVSSETGVLEGL